MTVPHTRMVTPTNFLMGKRWEPYKREHQPNYVERGVIGSTYMEQPDSGILEEELAEIYHGRSDQSVC